MNDRAHTRAAVSLAAVIALTAFACSSAPVANDGEGSDSKLVDKKKDKDTDGDTKTDTDPTTPTTPTKPSGEPLKDDGACGKQTTGDACATCCEAKSPGAMDAANDVFLAHICQASTCNTACDGALCGTANENAELTEACFTCIDTNYEAAETKATAECAKTAGCKLVNSCLETSCGPLFEKEGGNGADGAPGGAQRIAKAEHAASTSLATQRTVNARAKATRRQ